MTANGGVRTNKEPTVHVKQLWTITGEFIYRHHVVPRVKLYVPQEETLPFPMKYIDITRTTFTSLDVMLGKQVEDYWNVDGERELSDAWTGFTRFILLNERPPDGTHGPGGDLQENKQPLVQTNVWPEMWKIMSDAAKKKAKQRWAIEKPKLDNARQLGERTIKKQRMRNPEPFWLKPCLVRTCTCFVQVSTTQFCSFSFLMAHVSDGTNVPISPAAASSSNVGFS